MKNKYQKPRIKIKKIKISLLFGFFDEMIYEIYAACEPPCGSDSECASCCGQSYANCRGTGYCAC
ncbi:hypothetical protein A3J20_01720 [Candidatus Gottesmanbacteria bacterium RIFCSPLOWO2_02_FULL_42_29]|uniref:Uncharacterized protein n=2 Tax=Candidatus Gottesmaniibacteriota TaxID=1752720 RepID=A0A1F6BB42_9BACT|nr:MAG: hypothetical protein UV09_C0022G0025 [Candidatus Gottesmanbacteria bacterium GW2011_GWA2_42_18]OGG10760.1 MAG: hypothetical protein A2781_03815 [Candidatus Gottesmanbacteria bacterium RIFCSPHIGHO2_01_FULL_42_27]OGG21923.1 MAG: hypothetical protein A3E72_01750 [Candidatus Gottesmanbacteria bacterium RIFCSPHIGHO2_12_FULL_43_26]OGG34181.1 MAG: hypothetical protein A2968_03335 [Candidatus Gottesmanbacteria bacterium RIFCSPLOWO2_01_FULL_42_22]OGG35935.1 MAG: hypothetical protein A3G68_07350 